MNPIRLVFFFAVAVVPSSSEAFSVIGVPTSYSRIIPSCQLASLQTSTTNNEFSSSSLTDTSCPNNNNNNNGRRGAIETLYAGATSFVVAAGLVGGVFLPNDPADAAEARIDVNNALAREFTAFPGLYPTIASKIVKGAPYKNKQEIYAILNEIEQDRLKQYDKAIVINKPDAQLLQFKTSQICKYECGSRVSSSYRDEQIKAVQRGRQGLE